MMLKSGSRLSVPAGDSIILIVSGESGDAVWFAGFGLQALTESPIRIAAAAIRQDGFIGRTLLAFRVSVKAARLSAGQS
jgi:hypothetical protein